MPDLKRIPAKKRPPRKQASKQILFAAGLVLVLLIAIGTTLYVRSHRHTNDTREIVTAALKYCQSDWALHEQTPLNQIVQANDSLEDMEIKGDIASWTVDCQDKRFQLDSNAATIVFHKNANGTWQAVTSAFLW